MARHHALRLPRTPGMSAAALGFLVLLVVLLAGCGGTVPNPPAGLGGKNGVGPADGMGGSGPSWNTQGTGGAEAAIDWAESFMTGGANAAQGPSYHLLCLYFVANAYGSAYAHANSAWELAQTMQLHDPTDPGKAPRGALMFFDFTSTNYSYRLWGHVGISLGPNPREKAPGGIAYGDGTMISARSTVVIDSHIKTDSFWGKYYRGWAWPPASWGPLAQQAPSSVAQSGTVQSGSNTCLVQCAGSGTIIQNPVNNTGGNGNGGGGGQPPTPTPTHVPPTPTPTATATATPTPTPLPPPPTWSETAGGNANTWTNYTNAGGVQGPTVPGGATIQIACRLTGFKVADGNTWWYRIAQSPWSNAYYVSADAFYNNGQTSGSLIGTPWVDTKVAMC
ncbi:MAG TPA: hypothetical protein VE338_02035 [Ktedonobacterales bacterium]|nr:hypothetical protein [Ktedonobacterales bacterium]